MEFDKDGEANDCEQCGYCRLGEIFCTLLNDKEVEPNNICDKWEKEEW